MARHIDRLEVALDLRLFHRRQTGYVLTEAGKELLPMARQLAANAKFIERRAAPLSNNPVTRIRLELPEVLGPYLIIPGLAQGGAVDAPFRLEIINSAESVRLSDRSNDIVIRLKRPESGGYTARKIGKLSRALYCAQSYLDKRGTTAKDAVISDLDLVGWTDPMGYLPTASWFRQVTDHKPLSFQALNMRLQIDAIVCGLGVGALPKFVAETHGLVRVGEPDMIENDSEIWLLRSEETRDVTHIDTVVDWIETAVKDARHKLVFDD